MILSEAANNIQKFSGTSLTNRVSEIERLLKGKTGQECTSTLTNLSIENELLTSAIVLKSLAGQINVLIHAVGILLTLPHILTEGEIIESLSLGAGNTGRDFDLETNIRVAEFKFINWRGGAESIRQNSLFKDFYYLAEYIPNKERYLYVIDDKYPLKFFTGKRALSSVLSKNYHLQNRFYNQYENRFSVVCEYFEYRKEFVHIVDISKWVPEF